MTSNNNLSSKRLISDLLRPDIKVYVYCSDEKTQKQFMADAESEGFIFGDGLKPSERDGDDIMAVNNDKTICYVGFTGRLAFHQAFTVSGKALVKVDYKKYIEGSTYYFYTHS